MFRSILSTLVAMLALYTNLWAGGAGSRFSGRADNILKQDPNLYEMVTNRFTILEDGFLGPLEQRVINGVLGMHYVYYEFKAFDTKSKSSYLLRIHFKDELADPKADRTFNNRLLDRLVIIPQKETPLNGRRIEPQAEQDGGGQRVISSEPTPNSSHTTKVEVKVYGHGNNKDIRYQLVMENGKIDAGEYAHQKAIRASDGTAGFRTELTEQNHRGVHLFIEGTQNKTTYTDIDGDGILDAMENRTSNKLFIWAESTWLEVGQQKVGFHIGNSRRTIEDKNGYVFKTSRWVKE